MSLKDLLPEGAYDEIVAEAHTDEKKLKQESATLMVTCPTCKKRIPYDRSNPFRPFCSERCKLIDLGAWASEERTIAGRPLNEDEDADLLQDPNLPVRNVPGTDE